jgi:gamma-glutamyltranspeptidase
MAADTLRQGGSAMDAAITGMLCSGAVQPESSGIGGGGFMTVRLNNGSVFALNFRETAPLAADENMFDGNASLQVMVHPACCMVICSGYRAESSLGTCLRKLFTNE